MLGKAPLLFAIVIIVSIAYSFKTFSRNNDWESDFGLFSKDIESYPNSTHLLFYMGNHLSGTERKEVLTDKMSALGYSPQQINDSSAKESAKSIYYLSKSLSIYPALPSDGYNQLGKAYFNIGQLDSAYKYYTIKDWHCDKQILLKRCNYLQLPFHFF
jgi:tetratricopeptide (TPR) repeat protein